MSKARDPKQADLFELREAYPVLEPTDLRPATDFNRQLANDMAAAIRQSGKARDEIADEMTRYLGYEDNRITVAQLNAYTSAARETHTISVVRMRAFVRATGANWLWKRILADDGLTILEPGEAHFARAAILQKQGEQMLAAAKAELDLAPVTVRVPRGRR